MDAFKCVWQLRISGAIYDTIRDATLYLPPIYDSRHLQADCQEPGSAPELYAR